jgi:hypothetical protein
LPAIEETAQSALFQGPKLAMIEFDRGIVKKLEFEWTWAV